MSRRLRGYPTEHVSWWQRSEIIQGIIEQFEQWRREKIAQVFRWAVLNGMFLRSVEYDLRVRGCAVVVDEANTNLPPLCGHISTTEPSESEDMLDAGILIGRGATWAGLPHVAGMLRGCLGVIPHRSWTLPHRSWDLGVHAELERLGHAHRVTVLVLGDLPCAGDGVPRTSTGNSVHESRKSRHPRSRCRFRHSSLSQRFRKFEAVIGNSQR
ncbi:hypothetical protein CLCR_08907 [Cladophialophora carrionii]|uniref:Uncharacterized protein n=1 Tax=Cladophialophora carrionii TaxID=86049 RepID=A0A1C1CSU7_9EURO|nr:hypothetical protein CLCR_08907 [Cladophialophora carrionii]